MKKLIIVSNRLPITVVRSDQGFVLQASTGGLVTGLTSLLNSENVLWIGWDGLSHLLQADEREQLNSDLKALGMCAVSLSEEDVKGYYNDFSNGIIWPLYHYLTEKMPLTLSGWEKYCEINSYFCDLIVSQYDDGDVIWIHDYHLQLLPALLRARLPKARIGFFLHIPFPSSEVFRILPWRSQILEGLLGADVVGFHTHAYTRHFQSSLLRILGISAYADHLSYEGRSINVGAFPLGVDVNRVMSSVGSAQSELALSLARIKSDENIKSIMVAIDRLDYTKGLPRRLLAFEKLLEDNPDIRGTVCLVQIAAPSRDQVSAYEAYRSQVEGLVGRINGRFGMPGYQPIHYVSRSFSQEEILAVYPLVDVMVVTPLRDGMNLVAKEFIAMRQDLEGVLILSEFAGAAEELGEAIQVNPYDICGTAQGMLMAIRMPQEERRARMGALRSRINQFDASAWARRFVEFLRRDEQVPELMTYNRPSEIISLLPKSSKKILFLDYDGTLFPIVRIPQLARPDKPLYMLLERIAARADLEVHLVSGRSHRILEQWFGGLSLNLHAEHGAMSREFGQNEWTSALLHGNGNDWQPFVRSILENFTKNTPGSFIEEKTHSLAWHYRMSDALHGERMANELRLHGRETFTPLGLEILPGKRMVEIRNIGINKGMIVRRVIERNQEQNTIIAIGDDITDEDMFQAVTPEAISVVVGDHASKAKHRFRDPPEVRRFLELLAAPGKDSL